MGRIVEIGCLREPVEVLDEPWPSPEERIGRIKHQNGENVFCLKTPLRETRFPIWSPAPQRQQEK